MRSEFTVRMQNLELTLIKKIREVTVTHEEPDGYASSAVRAVPGVWGGRESANTARTKKGERSRQN